MAAEEETPFSNPPAPKVPSSSTSGRKFALPFGTRAPITAMTPRSLSASSSVVMTPRAGDSRGNYSLVPTPRASSSSTLNRPGVRVTRGAKTTAKERSVLELRRDTNDIDDASSANTPRDRAIERRKASRRADDYYYRDDVDDNDEETLSNRLSADLAELEQIRTNREAMNKQNQQTSNPELLPKPAEVAESPMAQAILKWIKKEDSLGSSSARVVNSFQPGRMVYSFQVGKDLVAQRPKMILKSREEWEALENHLQSIRKLVLMIRTSLEGPKEPVRSLSDPQKDAIRDDADEEDEDMFPNLDEYKCKPRIQDSGSKEKIPRGIFEGSLFAPRKQENIEKPLGNLAVNDGDNEEPVLLHPNDEATEAVEQEYSECFPGVYVSSGFIYGLDDEDFDGNGGEDGQKGKHGLTKRQRQQRESRKLDNQLGKVTKLMNEKQRDS